MTKPFFIIFLLAVACVLPAQDDEWDFFEIIASEFGDLPPPPPVFNPMGGDAYNFQFPKVNVITGEYCEAECDLVVAGAEPLSYRRFYGNQGYKDKAYGHWRINPECMMVFNFELSKLHKRNFQKLAGCGEESGCFILYEKADRNHYTFDIQKHASFIHTNLSGQTHPLNTKVSYEKLIEKDDFCSYEGRIQDGSGRERHFLTKPNVWPRDRGDFGSFPHPPYQAKIVREKRPNGNIIEYEYTDFNKNSKLGYYLLKKITAYNAKKNIVLGSLTIAYTRGGKKEGEPVEMITLTGSDERISTLVHELRRVQRKSPIRPALYDSVLNHVITCWKPTQYYQYRWERSKDYFKAPFMYQVYQKDGRVLDTTYDLTTEKVIAQSAPIGPEGQLCPIARYEYHDDHTVVYDGENNKTLHYFNSDKRLTKLEHYQGNQLYSVERSEWDYATGNLRSKRLEDAFGNLFRLTEYTYDINHNVILQRVSGGNSLLLDDSLERTFSKNGLNLKISESDRERKKTEYSYIPDTNLLSSEIVYDNDRICQRTFYFYDQELNSVCIKKIIDDGNHINSEEFAGVTYRRIIEISPKRSGPHCIGLPEEIREKTIDANNNEILLTKIHYTYHPSGKISQEDHYDSNDAHRYTIKNIYDDNERLIATQDALGNETTFSYDNNFNLIEQRGPRSDMCKEWVYDLANRPIEEKVWLTDGTLLSRKKSYDKAGRVVSTSDEYGFTTSYAYDSLGRQTAIYYPDGVVVQKKYDILGHVIEESDSLGYTTYKNYNFRGQPTDIYPPDGSEQHFSYHENGGSLASHSDSQGTKIIYSYDIFDRPIKTTTYSREGHLLKSVTAAYSSFCKLSETDSEGNRVVYQHDYAGRKISEQIGEKKTAFSYDSLGRLAQTKVGDSVYREEFDLKGRCTEKTREDQVGALVLQEKFAYDAADNQTLRITSKGVFETTYDSLGKPLSKKDPLGFTTHYAYIWRQDYMMLTTDAAGFQTLNIYDARGREIEVLKKNLAGETIAKRTSCYNGNNNLTELTHFVFNGSQFLQTITHNWDYGPLGRTERFVEAGEKEKRLLYNAHGKLQRIIKPSGKELHYEWDDLGRLSRFFSSDFDYRYEYDSNDRLLTVYDSVATGRTSRSYNALGEITHEILNNGLKFVSSYDEEGNRTQLTLPDHSTINYSYRAGYLYKIRRKGLEFTYAARDLEGNLTQVKLPQQLGTISIERDPLSRIKKYSSSFYNALFPQGAYDSLGNLVKYIYTDSLGTVNCAYAYDDLNQLISENDHSYLFDSLNNRLKKDDAQHLVNHFCQIIDDGKAAYTYDSDGNLVFDGQWHYAYDTQDRLITLENGTMRIEHTYDPFHRRLSKKVFRKGSLMKSELYLWDGDNEIGIINEKGILVELRVLGEGLGAEIGAALLYELKGQTYVPIHDHRGCVVMLIDPKWAKPQESYRYTAFGEELTNSKISPWRFASKRVEEETGLLFFGRRYYLPILGRWITQDPQGFEDGYNLYAYLHNAPTLYCDPYGLWTNPFLNTRNAWDFLSCMTWPAFKALELVGQHLIPMPGLRDTIESVGRWGTGGLFSDPCAYQKNYSRIHIEGGKQADGISFEYGNGILTSFEKGIAHTQKFQETLDGAQVFLLYNGTQGFVTDLLACGVAKLGLITSYEKMCATYYKSTLLHDPGHVFNSAMHSQAGTRAWNTSKLLSPSECQQINMYTYGSSTLIPRGRFGFIENNISRLDFITCTSLCRYGTAIINRPTHVKFLKPTSNNPLKEHYFTGDTYWNKIQENGKLLSEKYFN